MWISATYRVVTPLFCTGTDTTRAELRLPSFKGALRFWWRALAPLHCGGDLETIRRQENALFGSSDRGQSLVLMQLELTDRPQTIGKGEILKAEGKVVGEGTRYLGYGVMATFASQKSNMVAGELTRACLSAPFDFSVHIRCRDLCPRQKTSLEHALIALGTFGGLGAKNRKGFGSLVLQSLLVDKTERRRSSRTIAELKKTIEDIRAGQEKLTLPEYTALSGQTRHVILSSNKKEPVELLDLVGRELVRYRSWGRNGKILGGKVDSEKNFKDDHDLMKGNMPRHLVHPRRVAFGLPHNYGKHNDMQISPHDSGLDRRASPLFIHIHECNASPVAVLSFLPARFLPKGRSAILVRGHKVEPKPKEELYRPIHDFLGRLLDRTKRKEEKLTDAIEVGS